MNHSKCPRCGNLAYEHLRTHSYCWECGYSPDQNAAPKQPLKSGQRGATLNSGVSGANSGGRGAAMNSGRLGAAKTKSGNSLSIELFLLPNQRLVIPMEKEALGDQAGS